MDFADIAAIAGLDASEVLDLEKYEEKEFELIKDEDVNIYLDCSSVMEKPFELKSRIEKGGRKVSDLSEITSSLRLVKQPHEIDSIRESAIVRKRVTFSSFFLPSGPSFAISSSLGMAIVSSWTMIDAVI